VASVLRNLQSEWNSLVPQAHARGLRGIRPLNIGNLREPISHRRGRLEWLRRELNLTAAFSVPVSQNADAFTFGAELELIMPRGMTREVLASHIRAAGVECNAELYGHSLRRAWKIVTDGSLGDYTHGCEVVSPVLSGDEGFAQLRKVCEVLTAQGCKVNKKCGFHVHIGARNENLGFFKSLLSLYAQAEPVIDSFVAPSRRGPFAGNGFCKGMRINQAAFDAAQTVDDVTRAVGQTPGVAHVRGSGRYFKINMQSYWQHGTVEFRQHQGTVDANKAENWVRFCLRMALAARSGAAPASTLEALLTTIGASETESRYIANRIAYFARATAERII
jgi:hypothetical protein